MYFRGPDGERLELISDPLGEMYGTTVIVAAIAAAIIHSGGSEVSK